jgi:predicted pyridoxine 5'-phosphate oxidase superfamily flavin-nucleotide-binding protein
MINLDEHISTHINAAFVPEGNVCWIATVNKAGEPNIGPKGSMMVLDDQSLAYWERTHRTTENNIEDNPNVAVMYRNAEERLQWRFHGVATVHAEGEVREQVMARTIPQELERDPERTGVAVVIRVDKMMNLAGEVLQQRD